MQFLICRLTSEALCMGERIKGGLFRPCSKIVRYTQITPALREFLEFWDIHATGYLVDKEGFNQTTYYVYAPKDRFRDVSKIPITVELLTNVLGYIFIVSNNGISSILETSKTILFKMGALRSKGFGQCVLEYQGIYDFSFKNGILNTRVPLEYIGTFGITITMPVYGYLFQPEPTNPFKGVYKKALYEGSVVTAPECLIQGGMHYERFS